MTLPSLEDDDLVDDDVIDGEAYGDLVLDADPAALVREGDGIGRIHEGFDVSDIVIEIPAPAAQAPAVEASSSWPSSSRTPPTQKHAADADARGGRRSRGGSRGRCGAVGARTAGAGTA